MSSLLVKAAVCAFFCSCAVSEATSWRGSSGRLDVALEIRDGAVRGELLAVACAAPPFMADILPARRLRHGRLTIRSFYPTNRGRAGFSVELRRAKPGFIGRVRMVSPTGCRYAADIVVRRVDELVAGGVWTGQTSQQSAVKFRVSAFGLYIRPAGGSGDVIGPTLLANCSDGAEPAVARPWATFARIGVDGTFVLPGDASTGAVQGRLVGSEASGSARYSPSGCDSGEVTWSAASPG